jgi:hypothetical protein
MSRRSDRHSLRRRFRFEPLEDRRMLAVITVTDLSDGLLAALAGDSKISLREAIEAANTDTSVDGSVAGSGADTIEFDPTLFAEGPQSLVLIAGQFWVTASLAINGPGSSLLTIDASGNDPTSAVHDGKGSRVFFVYDRNATVLSNFSLSALTLTGGDVGGGGAIYAEENLSLTDCVLFDNASGYSADVPADILAGGAILVDAPSGVATLTRCTLRENYTYSDGGAIATAFLSDFRIVDSSIVNNRARSDGGGVDIWVTPLIVQNSTIANNLAENGEGGGIRGDDAKITLINSTVSGNTSGRNGGGIGRFGGSVILDLQFSTVVNNHANLDGGGISRCSTSMVGSVVAGNSAHFGQDLFGGSATFDKVSYSLIGNREFTPLAAAPVSAPDAHGNMIGDATIGVIDPLLGPLADNGGPTLTHAPLAGSPLINRGDPAAVAGLGNVPAADQRGAPYARVASGRIDIGAVELQLPVAPTDFNSDGATDGADLLALQRGLGASGPAATHDQGDANGDHQVDVQDLAAWTAAFGSHSPSTVATLTASPAQSTAQAPTPTAGFLTPNLVDAALTYARLSYPRTSAALARPAPRRGR